MYIHKMWTKDWLIENAEKMFEKWVEYLSAKESVETKTEVKEQLETPDVFADWKNVELSDEQKLEYSQDKEIKTILLETKKNLEWLKTTINLPVDQEKRENYIRSLLRSIKTLDSYDKQSIQEIEQMLLQEQYDKNVVLEKMLTLIEDIESKTEKLSQADRQKLLDQKVWLLASNAALESLSASISPEKALQDAKEQAFVELTDELKKKWWMPNAFADKIHAFLVKKYIKEEKLNIWEKIVGWLAVAVVWLVMGKGWKSFFKNIDDLSFDTIRWVLWEKADKRKTVWEDIRKRKLFQETDPEKAVEAAKQKAEEVLEPLTDIEIQKWKEWFKNYITESVKNINGKVPTKEQVDRVVAKLDVSENTEAIQKLYRYFASWGTEWLDANVIDGILNVVWLPFVFGWKMIVALQEENIISWKDVFFEVVDGAVGYWVKWFKLFWKWLSWALWNISWDELWEQLWGMYDKTPDEAKWVLFSLIYRTQNNPVFRTMINIWEQATWLLTHTITSAGDNLGTLKSAMSDLFNKNISTSIKEMDDLLKYLPKWDEVVKTMKKTVSELQDVTKLLQVKNFPAGMTWAGFSEFVKKAWVNIADLPIGLQDLTKHTWVIDQKVLEKAIALEIPGICWKANIKRMQRGLIKNITNTTKGKFLWEANPYKLIDNAAQHLDDLGGPYKDVLSKSDRSIKKQIAKLNLSKKAIDGIRGTGKAWFYARDVQSAEDMVKQLTFLAKEAPSTLKFLVGKTPLLLVWGMALAQDGTPSEKMKRVMQDMKWLIPVIWPIMIMRDAWWMDDKFNIAQMTAWGVLLATDFIILWKRATTWWRKSLGKYIFQPVVDVYEMWQFGVNTFKRWAVLAKNTATLTKAEWFWQWLKWVGKGIIKSPRIGTMAVIMWLATAWYFSIDYFFWDKIDDETKAKLDDYEKNPEKLDKEVFANWNTLPQEEKNDYLKASVLARGMFSPESLWALDVKYDHTKNNYLIQLPQAIEWGQKDLLKEVVTDALSQLQPGATVSMQIAARGVVELRESVEQLYKDTPEPEKTTKKREYIQAMWYDADAILSA